MATEPASVDALVADESVSSGLIAVPPKYPEAADARSTLTVVAATADLATIGATLSKSPDDWLDELCSYTDSLPAPVSIVDVGRGPVRPLRMGASPRRFLTGRTGRSAPSGHRAA